MSRSNFSQISSLSGPSLSPVTDSLSLSASQGVLKELMEGMGWRDITGSVREHESQYQQDKLSLQAAVERYESDQNLETANQLLSVLDDHLVVLKKERQRVLEEQRHYKAEAKKEAVILAESPSSTWTQWFQQGISRIQHFFDSTPKQLEEKYANIAKTCQDQINIITKYRKQLRENLNDIVPKEKILIQSKSVPEIQHFTSRKLLSTDLGSQCLPKSFPVECTQGTPFNKKMQYTDNYKMHPSIATFQSDYYITTWSSQVNSSINTSNIYAFPSGVQGNIDPSNSCFRKFNTQTPQPINQIPGNQINPVVGSFSTGEFIIVWQSERSDGNYDLYAQCFSSDCSKSSSQEFKVNTNVSWTNHPVAIATFQDTQIIGAIKNYFVISWSQDSLPAQNKTSSIYAQFFQASYLPQSRNFTCQPMFSSELNVYTAPDYDYDYDDRTVSVGALNNGKFIITWREEGLSFRPFSVGGIPLQSAKHIDIPSNIGVFPPAIGALSNNFIIAVSSNYGGTGNFVDIALISAENYLVLDSTYTYFDYGSSELPIMLETFLGDNFVIIQENNQSTACGHGLYGQFYKSDISEAAAFFCLNYTSNYFNPVISGLEDGGFRLAWTSNSSLGQSDIYRAIYNNQGPIECINIKNVSYYVNGALVFN